MARRPRPREALLALVLLAAFWAGPGLAQSPEEFDALRRDVEALKKGQDEIQKRLDAIVSALRGRRAPEPFKEVVLSVDGAAVLGDPNAKVTLIEFSDYQCPYCARFFRETLPRLVEDYIETGKVRLVYRDFPIASLHPAAFEAALAARCAGEQGRYWEMHDRFFADQKVLAEKDWPAQAQALGLDSVKFQACLESDRHTAKVRQDMAAGQEAGVRGTPTFFLGLSDPDAATVKATKMLRGARPYNAFKELIDALLSEETG